VLSTEWKYLVLCSTGIFIRQENARKHCKCSWATVTPSKQAIQSEHYTQYGWCQRHLAGEGVGLLLSVVLLHTGTGATGRDAVLRARTHMPAATALNNHTPPSWSAATHCFSLGWPTTQWFIARVHLSAQILLQISSALWISKWHWGRFAMSNLLLWFSLPILIPATVPFSSIIRGWYNRPIAPGIPNGVSLIPHYENETRSSGKNYSSTCHSPSFEYLIRQIERKT
jgi:hypothetical protein